MAVFYCVEMKIRDNPKRNKNLCSAKVYQVEADSKPENCREYGDYADTYFDYFNTRAEVDQYLEENKEEICLIGIY